eukprot:m.58315 g.58315  ORF g.58315 m.58315 type:complete len:324 (-) comp12857_c1_seq1:55-1026(-)
MMPNATAAGLQEEHARTLARTEEWELDLEEIQLGAAFAEGAVGTVCKGRWRGLDVAVKKLKREVVASKVARADLINEILVLSHLRHPNIVMFLGAVTIGDTPLAVFEYMDGGSLESIFKEKSKAKQGLPWRPPKKTSRGWALDLARAICFLHNCNPMVVHRDLKPANLMLNSQGTLKVTDFGISKSIRRIKQSPKASRSNSRKEFEPYVMTGVTGSKRYMAPEVYRSEQYDESVDIFSFAMVAWYMHTGERPFRTMNGDEAVRATSQGRRPNTKGIALGMAQIIEACWSADPEQRPTASELVERIDALSPLPGASKRDSCAIQ